MIERLSEEQTTALKKKARAIRKAEGIQHCAALDRVAKEQGFASWAMLMLFNRKEAKDATCD